MNTFLKQRITLKTIALCTVPLAHAQNLVIDGGLEDTLKCPQTIGRFYHPTNANERYIEHWRATTLASPDLHHTCGFNGYQPRTGNGYAGIILYDPTEYREYITALLDTTLQQGICYYVEAWVALSSGSTLAVDQFQMHFSIGVPLDMSFPPPGPLALTAHLQAATAPTLTTYQRISGFYTATGGENAITFGNFMDNANTMLTSVSSVGQVQSYYFIDDVTVTRLDLGPDQEICAGDSATVIPNIQSPDVTYAWSDGSSGTTNTTAQGGLLALTISGNGTCSVTDALNITVDPCLGIDGNDGAAGELAWSGQDARGVHTFGPMKAGDRALVLDVNGRIILSERARSTGAMVLDLSHRSLGCYLLMAGGRCVRFVHRAME